PTRLRPGLRAPAALGRLPAHRGRHRRPELQPDPLAAAPVAGALRGRRHGQPGRPGRRRPVAVVLHEAARGLWRRRGGERCWRSGTAHPVPVPRARDRLRLDGADHGAGGAGHPGRVHRQHAHAEDAAAEARLGRPVRLRRRPLPPLRGGLLPRLPGHVHALCLHPELRPPARRRELPGRQVPAGHHERRLHPRPRHPEPVRPAPRRHEPARRRRARHVRLGALPHGRPAHRRPGRRPRLLRLQQRQLLLAAARHLRQAHPGPRLHRHPPRHGLRRHVRRPAVRLPRRRRPGALRQLLQRLGLGRRVPCAGQRHGCRLQGHGQRLGLEKAYV
ncbi:hypothetical protein CSHISOI_09541, partial [Colletotrichum shisoi]